MSTENGWRFSRSGEAVREGVGRDEDKNRLLNK
jgi:hypothetical protein